MTQAEGDALYVAARIHLQRMSYNDPRRQVLASAMTKLGAADEIRFEEDNDPQDDTRTL
jgi:hypothetical protein